MWDGIRSSSRMRLWIRRMSLRAVMSRSRTTGHLATSTWISSPEYVVCHARAGVLGRCGSLLTVIGCAAGENAAVHGERQADRAEAWPARRRLQERSGRPYGVPQVQALWAAPCTPEVCQLRPSSVRRVLHLAPQTAVTAAPQSEAAGVSSHNDGGGYP